MTGDQRFEGPKKGPKSSDCALRKLELHCRAYAPCPRIGNVPKQRPLSDCSTTVTSFNETKHLDVVKETRDAHLLNMVDANVAPEDHDADTSKMAHDQDADDIAPAINAGRTYRDLVITPRGGPGQRIPRKAPDRDSGLGRLHLAHQEPNKPAIHMGHENQHMHGPAIECAHSYDPRKGSSKASTFKVRKYGSICAATTT